MSIVTAHQCDDCGRLYLEVKDVETCIKEHKKEEKRKQKKEAAEKAFVEFSNFARLNATSWDHLQEILLQQMRTVDPKATLDIRISVIGSVTTTHCHPIGGKRYIYNPTTEEGLKNNDEAVYPAAYPAAKGSIKGTFLLSNGKGMLPTDFASWVRENIKGIHTGGGSGTAKGGFGYDLTLFIQDFPLILDKFIKFKVLEQESFIYAKEKKRLLEDYTEYHHFKCYSDPAHAAYTMELKELENKVAEMKSLIEQRKIALDDEREVRTTPAFSFDSETLKNLKDELKA